MKLETKQHLSALIGFASVVLGVFTLPYGLITIAVGFYCLYKSEIHKTKW